MTSVRYSPQTSRSPLINPTQFRALYTCAHLLLMRGLSGSAWQRGRVAVWWLGLGLRIPSLVPVGGAQPVCPMTGGEGRTCKSNPPGVASDILIRGTKVENMPPWARFDQALLRRLERAAVRTAFVPSAPSLLSPDAEGRSGSWCCLICRRRQRRLGRGPQQNI